MKQNNEEVISHKELNFRESVRNFKHMKKIEIVIYIKT